MSIDSYRVSFKPVNGYWFTSFLLKSIEGKTGCFTTTLDLGVSTTRVCVENGELVVNKLRVNIEFVKPSEDDRVVLLEESGAIYEVVKHTIRGFYKLKAVAVDKAPTLEISGIHMHRITNVDPWTDTLLKVNAARLKRGCRVLDTCMGLGYTAIASVLRGSNEVYTFEIDENVIWIAERNPWSRLLAESSIRVHLGDVTKLVHYLPSSFFHRVIHDPPRFTRTTGELYSTDFYMELFRVLKPNGLLFHYTGEPRRHGAPSILKGIKERLEKAGFRVLSYDEKAQGYIAYKLP
ncbi:MAG: methyltransferase [Desulfurococcaceae archaeon]